MSNNLSDSLEVSNLESMNNIQRFLDLPGMKIFVIPILLLIIAWILKGIYDKYIVVKPLLFLKLGHTHYMQKIKGYDVGHELSWNYECEIKNNSKFDAYNIELFEVKSKDLIVSNKVQLQMEFPKNNHLESNDSKSFEIRKSINVGPDVLLKRTFENGKWIIIPGLKIPNPQDSLKPTCLNRIKLVLKYKNEKGKAFYVKFKKTNGRESCRIKTIRPYLFQKLITITEHNK